MVKNPSAMQEMHVQSLSQGDSLEKGMITHSSILAGRIPWTEEPGRLTHISFLYESQKSQNFFWIGKHISRIYFFQ